jgi:hypothetical protein
LSYYALILLPLLFQSQEARQPIPRFEQYPAAVRHIATPAQPVLKKLYQDRLEWREAIQDAARHSANFAGQYRMVSLPGAGTAVELYVVLDLVSGAVAEGPLGGVIGYPPEPMRFEGGDMGVVFEPDSRPLVMRGCLKQGCGTFYYEWSAPRWKLLRQVLTKN